jgi:pimeloyl-ACP methyl ester carboxylesterase
VRYELSYLEPSSLERNLEPAALDLALSSGTVRAYRRGTPGAPAALCIPGLDANARSFDLIARALARSDRDVVVLDLRGRGASPRTRVGTYGWEKHAADVLEVATRLGFETFDVVGHSMGALVGMQAAVLAPQRVRRLVAIDTAGPADLLALPTIASAAFRLAFVYPATGVYCATVRATGVVEPWEELWKRSFVDDLQGFHGWVRPRTSFRAVLEDLVYNLTHTAATLWPRLRTPALLIRATRRLPPFGLVVGARLRDAFLRGAASAQVVEVDANHYEVMAHPEALRAIDAFLARTSLVEANEPLDAGSVARAAER